MKKGILFWTSAVFIFGIAYYYAPLIRIVFNPCPYLRTYTFPPDIELSSLKKSDLKYVKLDKKPKYVSDLLQTFVKDTIVFVNQSNQKERKVINQLIDIFYNLDTFYGPKISEQKDMLINTGRFFAHFSLGLRQANFSCSTYFNKLEINFFGIYDLYYNSELLEGNTIFMGNEEFVVMASERLFLTGAYSGDELFMFYVLVDKLEDNLQSTYLELFRAEDHNR